VPGVLFLDRDGVLNEKAPEGSYVVAPDDLRLLAGVGGALGTLRAEVPGLRIAVVTNQRSIALGILSPESLEAVHTQLRAELKAAGAWIDRIEVCPHDEGVCRCRKPAIGLLERVMSAWPDASGDRCAMVGDSAIDIIAGHRFGARTYLVGDSARRAREARIARDAVAEPHEQALSLAGLVADGRLASWLRDGKPGLGGGVLALAAGRGS
jgi:D-glycero-D-manno-heptose 1,7-bisphosphate phosphatase